MQLVPNLLTWKEARIFRRALSIASIHYAKMAQMADDAGDLVAHQAYLDAEGEAMDYMNKLSAGDDK